MCSEAQRQGALLSHEDLANLLSSSPSTVKRDITSLRQKGEWVPTRGSTKDIGKGISHKSKIIELYLQGFQATEIALRTRHSLEAIKRYLEGFSRVTKLFFERLSIQEIRLVTGFSERLIDEYRRIYLQYKDQRESQRRLTSLLGEKMVKKGGQEMRTKQYPHPQYQRIQAKSLKNMLLHKFLNQYRYEKGKITASAIVEDIISLVKSYFKKVDTLESGKLIWLACALNDVPKRGKRIRDTQMIPVVLTLVNDEDVELLRKGVHKQTIKKMRMARMATEAFRQKGLLTQLDFSAILCMHKNDIFKSIREYQRENDELLPRTGYIHDCGPATSHNLYGLSYSLEKSRLVSQTNKFFSGILTRGP